MTVANEQPFILNLHDREFPKIRELREKEFDLVAGGNPPIPNCPPETPFPTVEITFPADGGDAGCDEDPRSPPRPGATFG